MRSHRRSSGPGSGSLREHLRGRASVRPLNSTRAPRANELSRARNVSFVVTDGSFVFSTTGTWAEPELDRCSSELLRNSAADLSKLILKPGRKRSYDWPPLHYRFSTFQARVHPRHFPNDPRDLDHRRAPILDWQTGTSRESVLFRSWN